MKFADYQENRPRGTYAFPIEFHHVDESHPQYYMPIHWHMEYELIRILEGSFRMSLDEREFTASSGDTVFLKAGTVHTGIPDHCVYECAVFDLPALIRSNPVCHREIQMILDNSITVFDHFTAQNVPLHQTVWQLFEALSSRSEGYTLLTLGAMYQFFGVLFTYHLYASASMQTPRANKRIAHLKRVLEYIDAHYDSTITLEELSEIACMSPKYFCRYFQELTHRSPIEYVNYYRIEEACKLLLNSDLSVTDISLSCGFNDPSYFIKMFKRYKGTTPKHFSSQTL